MKVSSALTLGAIGFLGLGAIIAQGYLTDEMVRRYGKNKQLDQALAVIVIILLIIVVAAAFFAYYAGRKDGMSR